MTSREVAVFGSDFTSTEILSRSKAQHLVRGHLSGTHLCISSHESFVTNESWIAALPKDGPWVFGVDFPLGQPRAFCESLGIETYDELIARASSLSPAEWKAAVKGFRGPNGKRRVGRLVDGKALAGQAMNVDNPPVGMMFHRGAPLLYRAGFSMAPVRLNSSEQIVIEAYPALVAAKAMPSRNPMKAVSYKGGKSAQWMAKQACRQIILDRLPQVCPDHYGLSIQIAAGVHQAALTDSHGDILDSVLAAIQAAWAATQPGLGIPVDADPLEGWICDPILITA